MELPIGHREAVLLATSTANRSRRGDPNPAWASVDGDSSTSRRVVAPRNVWTRTMPRISAIIHANSAERTRAFETLALCGGALILAGAMQEARLGSSLSAKITATAAESGRLLFAFSLVVFGIDHIPAARFVATLVPAWIPWHLFWAYFTAAGFIAAGLSIAAGIEVRLSASLLGLMFFLWVVLLHSPRVAAHLHNEGEWNSLFVALAMSGAAFVLAGKPSK